MICKDRDNWVKNTTPRYGSMDPEHASIAGRLFFSQAEKNQKAKRRGEKLLGEGACHPDGSGELKLAHRTTGM